MENGRVFASKGILNSADKLSPRVHVTRNGARGCQPTGAGRKGTKVEGEERLSAKHLKELKHDNYVPSRSQSCPITISPPPPPQLGYCSPIVLGQHSFLGQHFTYLSAKNV